MRLWEHSNYKLYNKKFFNFSGHFAVNGYTCNNQSKDHVNLLIKMVRHATSKTRIMSIYL